MDFNISGSANQVTPIQADQNSGDIVNEENSFKAIVDNPTRDTPIGTGQKGGTMDFNISGSANQVTPIQADQNSGAIVNKKNSFKATVDNPTRDTPIGIGQKVDTPKAQLMSWLVPLSANMSCLPVDTPKAQEKPNQTHVSCSSQNSITQAAQNKPNPAQNKPDQIDADELVDSPSCDHESSPSELLEQRLQYPKSPEEAESNSRWYRNF